MNSSGLDDDNRYQHQEQLSWRQHRPWTSFGGFTKVATDVCLPDVDETKLSMVHDWTFALCGIKFSLVHKIQ